MVWVFRSCSQNWKIQLIKVKKSQNFQNLCNFSCWKSLKIDRFRDFLAFFDSKNCVFFFEILKTVPESSQYQLSFSIKIFWKFQTKFSEIAKTYNKMLLYPWYGYRLHVFSSYLWWKLNNNSLSLYLARPLNFYRQMFDAGPYFSRSWIMDISEWNKSWFELIIVGFIRNIED